jgi:hypothetical protein
MHGEERRLQMAKSSKEPTSLYCGTTERIAKLSPREGVNPASDPVYLSTVYPGLLAFYASTKENDRYGIIEVELSFLDSSNFLPCEWYLEQTARQKAKNSREQHKRQETFRKNLDKYRDKWKDSLQKIGVCVYDGFIPKKAIRRITIYDPASNPAITHAIVSARISLADYKNNYVRNQALTRWLTGESVTVEEWLGAEFADIPKEEKEQLAEHLQNKLGLDIFYHEPPAKGL